MESLDENSKEGTDVQGLFCCPKFTDFGPSHFSPSLQRPALYHVYAQRVSLLRYRVAQACPRRPGVYGMVDAAGELIYVGKAKCLRSRLASYFRPRSRDPRAGRILDHTRRIVWELVSSEFAALLRELELIHRWRPRFNVQGQPDRYRRTYLCIGRQPAPHVFLAAHPPADVLACFGPVAGVARAREAVRRLNDWFQLRDCPRAQAMIFGDQGELFPVLRSAGCIRHEIGTCLGPCAAACTRAAYAEQVRAAQAFLEGADLAPLQALEREMAVASAGQAFERAASLRDRLTPLQWLHGQLSRLRLARHSHSFVYPLRGYGGTTLWYLIRRAQVAAVIPAPRTEVLRRSAAKKVEAIFLQEDACNRTAAADEIDAVLLVAAWFRRHPEERRRTLGPRQALHWCRKAPV